MNTRYVLTLCTALVVGGVLLTGSANALGKADEKTPINDSWLTAKTKIALFADARVKGSEINVETTQGVVLIRGKVDTDAAKQAAEGIAKGIDGVKTVKNDLQVVAPAKREAIDDKDAAITTRVNEQIAKDSSLTKSGIHAQTNAGVVSLSGEVADLMTSAQASWTAWQVPRREVGEERSYGEGEGLRSYSQDTRALRPSISDHSGVDGRQRFSLS